MSPKFSFLFIFFFSFVLNAQDLDKLSGLPHDTFEKEIRIYKDRGITNSGIIFRIFEENKVWKAEKIQWFLPREISSDEFESIKPIKIDLSKDKNLEVIFMNLEALNIGFLPKEEAFEYKKEKKSVIWDGDEKQFSSQISKIAILDGTGYSVNYKSEKNHNEFDYSNPESYLKKFPEIDELNSFVEILKYIRKEFKIDF